MKCPVCNQLLPDDSVFCQYCGAKLSHEEEQPVVSPTPEPVIAPEPVAAQEPVGHSEVVLGFLRGSDFPSSVAAPDPEPEPEAVSEPISEPAAEPVSPAYHAVDTPPAAAEEPAPAPEARSYVYTEEEKPREAVAPKNKKRFPWIAGLAAVLAVCLVATLYYAGTLQTEVKDLTASLTEAEAKVDELKDLNMTLKRKNNTLTRENEELDGDLQFFAENMGIIVEGDNNTYHRYDCFKVKTTSTYEAHNTNYCEWLEYSRCPYCW